MDKCLFICVYQKEALIIILKKKYTEITTGKLQSYIDNGLLKIDKEITEDDFVSSCDIKKVPNGFKLLNKGESKI